MIEILSYHRQIVFDRALGQMLRRHFYLVQHQFVSSDRFEGWVYTYNRNRYKIVVSFTSSCSCVHFREDYVCKHFLFVLKRVFNVNLYSFDLRLAVMQYHQFTIDDLERIFQGQIRRLCPIVPPNSEPERQPLTLKRQSIDVRDVCPICFERLLLTEKNLVTCFQSCGKSMHEHCMKVWKRANGDPAHCPLCQVRWIQPSTVQQAVLDYYAHRSHPSEQRQRYILCCLYNPPDCC